MVFQTLPTNAGSVRSGLVSIWLVMKGVYTFKHWLRRNQNKCNFYLSNRGKRSLLQSCTTGYPVTIKYMSYLGLIYGNTILYWFQERLFKRKRLRSYFQETNHPHHVTYPLHLRNIWRRVSSIRWRHVSVRRTFLLEGDWRAQSHDPAFHGTWPHAGRWRPPVLSQSDGRRRSQLSLELSDSWGLSSLMCTEWVRLLLHHLTLQLVERRGLCPLFPRVWLNNN